MKGKRKQNNSNNKKVKTKQEDAESSSSSSSSSKRPPDDGDKRQLVVPNSSYVPARTPTPYFIIFSSPYCNPTLTRLPEEILIHILRFCPRPVAQGTLIVVCRSLMTRLTSEQFMRQYCILYWNLTSVASDDDSGWVLYHRKRYLLENVELKLKRYTAKQKKHQPKKKMKKDDESVATTNSTNTNDDEKEREEEKKRETLQQKAFALVQAMVWSDWAAFEFQTYIGEILGDLVPTPLPLTHPLYTLFFGCKCGRLNDSAKKKNVSISTTSTSTATPTTELSNGVPTNSRKRGFALLKEKEEQKEKEKEKEKEKVKTNGTDHNKDNNNNNNTTNTKNVNNKNKNNDTNSKPGRSDSNNTNTLNTNTNNNTPSTNNTHTNPTKKRNTRNSINADLTANIIEIQKEKPSDTTTKNNKNTNTNTSNTTSSNNNTNTNTINTNSTTSNSHNNNNNNNIPLSLLPSHPTHPYIPCKHPFKRFYPVSVVLGFKKTGGTGGLHGLGYSSHTYESTLKIYNHAGEFTYIHLSVEMKYPTPTNDVTPQTTLLPPRSNPISPPRVPSFTGATFQWSLKETDEGEIAKKSFKSPNQTSVSQRVFNLVDWFYDCSNLHILIPALPHPPPPKKNTTYLHMPTTHTQHVKTSPIDIKLQKQLWTLFCRFLLPKGMVNWLDEIELFGSFEEII